MSEFFDKAINYGVPALVIGFVFFLFYQKFNSTFSFAFDKLKSLFGALAGKAKNKAQDSYEVVYTYGRN